MSDLFGNHIVGFPMRRLSYSTLVDNTVTENMFSHVGCNVFFRCPRTSHTRIRTRVILGRPRLYKNKNKSYTWKT